MKKYTRKILLLIAAASLALCGGAFVACNEEAHSGDHVYSDWVEVTPAGCEVNGVKKQFCTIPGCGAELTEEIPALGHDWGVSKVTEAATCQHGGKRVKTCNRCGTDKTEDTDPLEHDWVPENVIKAATCEEGGKELQRCSMCRQTREEDTKPLEHDWGDPEIIKPANCEEDGVQRKVCKRADCGKDVTETIGKLGHQWMNTKVIKPATCEEAGEQEQACQRPGCPTKTQTVPIPALNHSWQNYYTVDVQATFDHAGSKSFHCNRCEKTTGQTEIPQLNLNTPIDYEFRTLRNNGELLIAPAVTLIIKDAETGEEVARSTPADLNGGVFVKPLLPKNYTVTVENAPEGYTCGTNFTVSPFDPYCNVYLTASVRQGTPSKYSKGSVMYDFTIPAGNNTAKTELKLSEILKTKRMVLLNFWFVNCGYCEQEFPDLQNVYMKYKNVAEVIALNVPQSLYGETGSMEEINGYLASNPSLTFQFAQNAVVGLAGYFGVYNFPTSVVIDAEGVVCEVLMGPQSSSEFERLFAKYTADDYLKTSAPAAERVSLCEAAILPEKRRTV